MELERYKHFMNRALVLAKRGALNVSPNPMVGCVIVNKGKIVGEGWHEKVGGPHAEIVALNMAKENARGAEMYITLEPCCHYNRTPPCVDAIKLAQISHVIIPCIDPNKKVSGKGIEALKRAGIKVTTGILEQEATNLNKIFFHYQKTLKPFIILKWAMSLDGMMTTKINDSRQLSCNESLKRLHKTRAKVDAILIGANTARADDPLLTSRLNSTIKNPLRIILSSDLNLPTNLNVFKNQDQARTIVVTTCNALPHKIDEFKSLGIQILITRSTPDNKINMEDMLLKLGKMEVTSILVEGGRQVHNSFFAAQCVNEIEVYLTPYIIADLPSKISLSSLNTKKIGSDVLITACPE